MGLLRSVSCKKEEIYSIVIHIRIFPCHHALLLKENISACGSHLDLWVNRYDSLQTLLFIVHTIQMLTVALRTQYFSALILQTIKGQVGTGKMYDVVPNDLAHLASYVGVPEDSQN